MKINLVVDLPDEQSQNLLESLKVTEAELVDQFSQLAAEYSIGVRECTLKTTAEVVAAFSKHEFFPKFIFTSGMLHFLQQYMMTTKFMNSKEGKDNG